MEPLTINEISLAVCGKLSGDGSEKIKGITTDSRRIKAGELFIPLKGENFDGHDFIEAAFNSGAACVLTEKELPSGAGSFIKVSDTRKALKDLASYYRGLFDIKVVAITGSVGKTSTKDMISGVLSEKFSVLKSDKNFNNEIGLPLTVFKLKRSHQVMVLEMGMNHFGEIRELSRIARPDIAVITNIGVSHMENLGSREGILKAKSEIFEFMPKGGVAVLNSADDMLSSLDGKLKCDIKWFGTMKKDGIYVHDFNMEGLLGIGCVVDTPKGSFAPFIQVPGVHMCENAAAATAVALEFDLELADIKRGLEKFKPEAMRMSVEKTKIGINLINDAYNANPVSMRAAIDVLKASSGRKIAFLGDMFELGNDEEEMHYALGEYVAENGIDMLFCIGKLSEAISRGAKAKGLMRIFWFSSVDDFLNASLEGVLRPQDTALVKASRGMHFEKVADKIREVK